MIGKDLPAEGPQLNSVARARSALALLRARLEFGEPMESDFRIWYVEYSRAQVKASVWVSMVAVMVVVTAIVPFDSLRRTLFGSNHSALITACGFTLFFSCVIVLLSMRTHRSYTRWYPAAARIVAPIQATCFIVIDCVLQQQDYTITAWMPLVAIAPYFLFGMLQAQAARSSLLVVVIYFVGGELAHIHGAQRWFDFTTVAVASIIGAIVHFLMLTMVRETYAMRRTLAESAQRDGLTGIHNRRMFNDHMERVWNQAVRDEVQIGLLLIDLDLFKSFNDEYGHQAGDLCLMKVASLLPQVARRPLDLSARYGGEELVVVLYDTSREKVENICRQLHALLTEADIPHSTAPATRVTFSIGAACVEPRAGRQYAGLIQLADQALYAAKQEGRNRSVVMDREYDQLVTGSFRMIEPGNRAA